MSKKAKLWSRILAVVVIVLAMGAGCTFVGLNFFDVDLYSQRIICLVGIWAAVTVMICIRVFEYYRSKELDSYTYNWAMKIFLICLLLAVLLSYIYGIINTSYILSVVSNVLILLTLTSGAVVYIMKQYFKK